MKKNARRFFTTTMGLSVVAVAAFAHARDVVFHHGPSPRVTAPFAFVNPLPTSTPAPAAKPRPASLQGSTIVALPTGALVLDGDSGTLVRTDDAGAVTAKLLIGEGASQMVMDRNQRVYVVDRAHDRVVVVDVTGDKLERAGQIRTGAEPYGIALLPGEGTILVTTVAGKSLTAYNTAGRQLWTREIGAEPRGVSVSPGGKEAVVTFLTMGAVARIDLDTREISYVSLDPAGALAANTVLGRHGSPFLGKRRAPHFTELPFQAALPGSALDDTGRAFARNAFAALWISSEVVVVPHQVSTPHQDPNLVGENTGSYGGGGAFAPPVAYRLGILGTRKGEVELAVPMATAQIAVHQPRAMAYDGKRDILYVAGYGSDDVMAIGDASQASMHVRWTQSVRDKTGTCGPNGLALGEDGKVLVFCELTRKVATLVERDDTELAYVSHGDELTGSKLTAEQQRGRALFRQGNNPALSAQGAMACSSCHAEGRTDGLSWRIEGKNLQTPILSGRLAGTHPFKWDGRDKTLSDSLRNTVKRLGGTGITAEEARDLAAFVLSMDAPRAPAPEDPEAVARGERIFRSQEAGCASCHSGQKLTDGKRYDLADDMKEVDTPSLVGLALSAPYYHDGSAATLRAVVLENGTVHGMGRMGQLSEKEIDDLIAYLETL